MKNKKLYNKTINILVNAYFNNTLEHGMCTMCAVGNLVAANMGYTFKNNTWNNGAGYTFPRWNNVHMYTDDEQKFDLSKYVDTAKKEIDSTGYSPLETAAIELAFETANKGKSKDEYMFNGLMAVVNALDKIHENIDVEITTTSKNKFVMA